MGLRIRARGETESDSLKMKQNCPYQKQFRNVDALQLWINVFLDDTFFWKIWIMILDVISPSTRIELMSDVTLWIFVRESCESMKRKQILFHRGETLGVMKDVQSFLFVVLILFLFCFCLFFFRHHLHLPEIREMVFNES